MSSSLHSELDRINGLISQAATEYGFVPRELYRAKRQATARIKNLDAEAVAQLSGK